MFGIILTHRSSPVPNRRPDLDRVNLSPRWETTNSHDLEEPAAGSSRGRQTEAAPTPGLKIFEPKPRKSRKADIERARRLLAAKLTYIAHPSFDDPTARDAILAPSPTAGDPEPDSAPDVRFPSREREAHLFRKMNYLKCLAGRIREGIVPDSPDRADLDEVERLQFEALKLKNQIVESHLRLVVSIARGHRFSTYATWAILNELTRHYRKECRRRSRSIALFPDSLASSDTESERFEEEQAQDHRRAAVERLLRRLDGRERRIVVNRHGIGGVPEQTLNQIGLDLGISKERVRQIEERAHAKLRGFARLESIEPSNL
jgi:RNA polymerase primary sigma factor